MGQNQDEQAGTENREAPRKDQAVPATAAQAPAASAAGGNLHRELGPEVPHANEPNRPEGAATDCHRRFWVLLPASNTPIGEYGGVPYRQINIGGRHVLMVAAGLLSVCSF